jgi:hypothetical protein
VTQPAIYLREGHVIGFTLPLHPTVEERWRAGHLHRVQADGTAWEGDPFALPGQAAAAAAEEPGPQPEDGGLARPKGNASRADWAAYAVALGACTEEQAAQLTRDELAALTTPPEDKPATPGV